MSFKGDHKTKVSTHGYERGRKNKDNVTRQQGEERGGDVVYAAFSID